MLFRQYWRGEVGGLLGWGLALAFLVLLIVGMYPVVMNSNSVKEGQRMMEQLPPAFKAYLGVRGGLFTINGWLQLALGGVTSTTLLVYTALASPGVLTREIDSRTIDFLLSLPVSRRQVLLSRFLGLVVNLGLLHAVLLASVGFGVTFFGYEPDWRGYALAALNAYLVFLALAGLLLVVTVFIDDYPRSMMITTGGAVAIYLLNVGIEPQSPLAWLRRMSFFSYYRPDEVLRTASIPWDNALPLILSAAALTLLAVWLFERKQIKI